ncbi:hypothetical protein CANCADRAFT_107060 [Tortispora caseinolytica NRRL Y-17796]|uniref:Uncharacterized protein n=1 Tax=Tortispora caseinolytica NRRL Y-17796 TaxID=767744 RepID=A0A1E4TFF7_9ASCO|nr:hypothetical protein CANCADRAFT_107060 [Tortispora caseinolytica NRRL Y-17796]
MPLLQNTSVGAIVALAVFLLPLLKPATIFCYRLLFLYKKCSLKRRKPLGFFLQICLVNAIGFIAIMFMPPKHTKFDKSLYPALESAYAYTILGPDALTCDWCNPESPRFIGVSFAYFLYMVPYIVMPHIVLTFLVMLLTSKTFATRAAYLFRLNCVYVTFGAGLVDLLVTYYLWSSTDIVPEQLKYPTLEIPFYMNIARTTYFVVTGGLIVGLVYLLESMILSPVSLAPGNSRVINSRAQALHKALEDIVSNSRSTGIIHEAIQSDRVLYNHFTKYYSSHISPLPEALCDPQDPIAVEAERIAKTITEL